LTRIKRLWPVFALGVVWLFWHDSRMMRRTQVDWNHSPVAILAPCQVAPLAPVENKAALAYEHSDAASRVNVEGMTTASERALARFQTVITKVGGSITVTSAYRPKPYQQHLQQVWDKWMLELRNNELPSCRQLRKIVAREFTRHQLLETQRPAVNSDHTRGIAFDAAVVIPKGARLRKRKVNVDYLARLSGIRRPAVARDPVHFRLAGAKRANT
jgi:D-alanyl-D-alanine dipeptidase